MDGAGVNDTKVGGDDSNDDGDLALISIIIVSCVCTLCTTLLVIVMIYQKYGFLLRKRNIGIIDVPCKNNFNVQHQHMVTVTIHILSVSFLCQFSSSNTLLISRLNIHGLLFQRNMDWI